MAAFRHDHQGQCLGVALFVASVYQTTGFNPILGTHSDTRALQLTLMSLHFKITIHTNLSATECLAEINHFVSIRTDA